MKKFLIALGLLFLAFPALAQLPGMEIAIGKTPVIGGVNTDCLNVTSGKVGQAACGAGTAADIKVGTTTVSSGTTTRILYDNVGVLGEYTLTGTGTVVAMQAAPTFSGTVTSGGNIVPSSNAGSALGTTSLAWGTSYIEQVISDTNLNLGANNSGYWRITGSAGNLTNIGSGTQTIGLSTGTGTSDTILSRAGAASWQLGAADVASGAVAQTLTFQGNTGSTTNGPLALIRGANGGSSTSVGGELRLEGGVSSAAAGTGGAVTIYTAPASAGNTPAAVATFGADKSTVLTGTLTAVIANVATTSAVCYNTGTGLFTYDATVGTCTVSALRYKDRGEPLPYMGAMAGLTALRTESWTYKKDDSGRLDSRVHVGLYADDVAAMDKRCAIYDGESRVENYDDRCVLAYIVAALRELKSVQKAEK